MKKRYKKKTQKAKLCDTNYEIKCPIKKIVIIMA